MAETSNCRFVYGTYVLPGWGCCNGHYNGLQRTACKDCGHERCSPLTIPPDLKQGVYCEEGGRTKVEIVHTWFEDHHPDHPSATPWTQFNLRLRSLESTRDGNFGPIKPGTEFSVGVNVKYVGSGMRCWSLESEDSGRGATAH